MKTRRVPDAAHKTKRMIAILDEGTSEAAKRDPEDGKSPSTAAGEFVREEIEHVREGKHGVRSPKQAIAIGLRKARRAGIPLGKLNPENNKFSGETPAGSGYDAGKPCIRKETSWSDSVRLLPSLSLVPL